MTDEYIMKIIDKYTHGSQHEEAVRKAKSALDVIVKEWAGDAFLSTSISGSLAKGTATTLGSDFDLFVSLSPDTTNSLRELYNMLFSRLSSKGYTVKKQNVSIGVVVNSLSADVIPAKKHHGHTNDHSIYVSKSDSWTQTNVEEHINIVRNSGRINEIKITKIWSKLHRLDFPSFYLELAVIDALKGKPRQQLDLNFQHILEFLSTEIPERRFVDPANTNNVISDYMLTNAEKLVIASKAEEGYIADKWSTVIW